MRNSETWCRYDKGSRHKSDSEFHYQKELPGTAKTVSKEMPAVVSSAPQAMEPKTTPPQNAAVNQSSEMKDGDWIILKSAYSVSVNSDQTHQMTILLDSRADQQHLDIKISPSDTTRVGDFQVFRQPF